MKKLKSFFKKHYKRFVIVSITAFMCFCFLFLNVSAAISNSEFQITFLDMNYVSLTQVRGIDGTVTEWEIFNPPSADGFNYGSWLIRKPFSIDEGTGLTMYFEQNMDFVVPDSYFSVSIPFGIYFIKNSVPNLSSVTNCVFEFNYLLYSGYWNPTPTLVWCDLKYSETASKEVVCLLGEAKFNLPLPNDHIFKEFYISLSSFNGLVEDGTSYAFAFRGPIELVHSYSIIEQEIIDKGITDESDLVNGATIYTDDSAYSIFNNIYSTIPSGVKNSLLAIRSIWINIFNRVSFVSSLIRFSVASGLFAFIVGMGMIIVGSLSRFNSRRGK